jgi:hypothetical protein
MTDSQGRSRPERSLSVGADLADEPRRPSRAFLWPIVSAVAAVGLILSVIVVVSRGTPSRPENAMAAPPAPRSSAPGTAEAKPDVNAKPDRESRPARPEQLPAAGDDTRRQPARPSADAPRSPAAPPAGPPRNPEPVAPPSGNPGSAGEDSDTQPTGTPVPSTPAPPQEPQVKLDGSAPAAPKSARVTALKADTGGGCTKSTSNDSDYACTITRAAPYYLPGTKDPRGTLGTGQAGFRCQSDGSKYSVANRVSRWWAWLTVGLPLGHSIGVWVPVVFLRGAPSDKPVPGLPLCDGAAESTKKPTTKSAGSTSGTSVEPARSGRG